jgi:hypothetical protein
VKLIRATKDSPRTVVAGIVNVPRWATTFSVRVEPVIAR